MTVEPLSAPLTSRRTVLSTALWTAPAISVAAATPAFAASSPLANVRLQIVRFDGERDVAVFEEVRDDERNVITPEYTMGRVRIDILEVENTGTEDLPAGELLFTFTMPDSWGLATGPDTTDALVDAERHPGWTVTYSGRIVTVQAQPGYGAIPAGESVRLITSNNDDDWAWLTDQLEAKDGSELLVTASSPRYPALPSIAFSSGPVQGNGYWDIRP